MALPVTDGSFVAAQGTLPTARSGQWRLAAEALAPRVANERLPSEMSLSKRRLTNWARSLVQDLEQGRRRAALTEAEQRLWLQARDAGVDPTLISHIGWHSGWRIMKKQAWKLVSLRRLKREATAIRKEVVHHLYTRMVEHWIPNFDGRVRWSTFVWNASTHDGADYVDRRLRNGLNAPNMYRAIRTFKRVRSQLENELQRVPTFEELASQLHWSPHELRRVLAADKTAFVLSLHTRIERKHGFVTLEELVARSPTPNLLLRVEQATSPAFRRAMLSLAPLEALTLYFREGGETSAALARALGVRSSRIVDECAARG